MPLSTARLIDMAARVEAGWKLKHNTVLAASFQNGDTLPRGGLCRLSPDEEADTIVLKVAERISAGTNDAELKAMTKCMASR